MLQGTSTKYQILWYSIQNDTRWPVPAPHAQCRVSSIFVGNPMKRIGAEWVSFVLLYHFNTCKIPHNSTGRVVWYVA